MTDAKRGSALGEGQAGTRASSQPPWRDTNYPPSSPRDVIALALSTTGAWADMAIEALNECGYVVIPRSALDEALEDMRDMRSYVPDFFAQKWRHDDGIAKVAALLSGKDSP